VRCYLPSKAKIEFMSKRSGRGVLWIRYASNEYGKRLWNGWDGYLLLFMQRLWGRDLVCRALCHLAHADLRTYLFSKRYI